MPISALDILDDDPLNLFGAEVNEKKKKKKKGRRQRKDIFSELGLDDEGETESTLYEGTSFLKPKLATPSKSVTFNDAIDVKEISTSENPSSKHLGEENEFNQSASGFEQTNPPQLQLDRMPNSSLLNHGTHSEELSTENVITYLNGHRNADRSSPTDGLFKLNKAVTDFGESTTQAGCKNNPSQKSVVEHATDQKWPSMDKLEDPEAKKCDPSSEALKQTLQYRPQEIPTDMKISESLESASPKEEQAKQKVCAKEPCPLPQPRPLENVSPVKPVTPTPRLTRSSSINISTSILKNGDKRTEKQDSTPRSQLQKADKGNRQGDSRTLPKPSPRRPSSCQLGRFIEIPKDGASDAASLRMMAYREWYLKSQKSLVELRRVMSEQESKEAERKKEAMENAQEKDKVFLAWQARKRAYFREQLKKKKEEETVRQKKLQEENEKKATSEKAFELWKSRKDTVLAKQMRERQQKQKTSKEAQQKEEEEKRKQAEQAFQAWKTKKEAEVQEIIRNRRQEQTESEKKKEEEMKLKFEKAAQAYYQWEMRKANSMENLHPTVTSERTTERAPWRPASGRPSMTRGLPY